MQSLYEIAHKKTNDIKDDYCISIDGTKLEDFFKIVISRLDLICNTPAESSWASLDPEGFYAKDDNFEFDFLIPINEYCIVGEITARSSKRNIEEKFDKFCKYLNYLNKLILDERKSEKIWQKIVKDKSQLRFYRNIKIIKGYFISTQLEKYDVNFPTIPEVVAHFKSDWKILVDYAEMLSNFAQNYFLHHFNVFIQPDVSETIVLENNKFLRSTHKQLTTGDSEQGEVYVFQISPYKIIPFTHVFRRDELPSLSTAKQYQRPLSVKKTTQIRNVLLEHPDFMFPNSILVVLKDSKIDSNGSLVIPKNYGTMSIIDGQHRLFSYASPEMIKKVGEDANIIVTAIKFFNSESAWKYSARTFLDINTNQTKVDRTLIDSIAYDILGKTDNRAIAAQVLLNANQKSQENALYGLFDTRSRIVGTIKPNTVITSLKSITDLKQLSKLNTALGKTQLDKRNGYRELFKINFPYEQSKQSNQDEIIQKFCQGVIWYFNMLKREFSYDFPERGKLTNSSLEYAKVLGGFLLLLRYFINNNMKRKEVEKAISNIKSNILLINKESDYSSCIFKVDTEYPILPSKNSARDNFNILKKHINDPSTE